MNSVIKAVVMAAVLQCVVSVGLSFWLFQHSDNMAMRYSQMAEANANAYSDKLVQDFYNRLQIERSQDREQLHEWTQRQISLRIDQAMRTPAPRK